MNRRMNRGIVRIGESTNASMKRCIVASTQHMRTHKHTHTHTHTPLAHENTHTRAHTLGRARWRVCRRQLDIYIYIYICVCDYRHFFLTLVDLIIRLTATSAEPSRIFPNAVLSRLFEVILVNPITLGVLCFIRATI